MLILDAKRFIILLHSLLSYELNMRGKRGKLPPDMVKTGDEACDEIVKMLAELDLPHSIKIANSRVRGASTASECHAGYDHLTSSVMLELEGRKFYGPLRPFEKYYDQQRLFGPEVFDSFPSANDDIYEAGMCLALERPTACVMHLMRVLEVCLAALANVIAVGAQNDWGSYIRKIGEELDRRAKAAGARTADEQFYAELASNFDRLRRAYRNPTMHPEKSYSQERAEEILLAVKSFMSHLPPRIFEF